MRTHAPGRGAVVTHTLCGRDLNPSCGSYGSHSSRPQLSSTPTCAACRRAKASAERARIRAAALATVAADDARYAALRELEAGR